MGDEPGDGEPLPPPIAARLDFEGTPCGTMFVEVTPPAARSIAADFLAADESELTDRQVEDVVCELANMICGSSLSRLEAESTFRLEAPVILSGGEARPESADAERSIHIGNGTIRVLLHLSGELCPTTKRSES
jgi:CheY-specific phosphatase CheX